jgi:FAD/FMN-containing dehydrogenase/Fe-S oxidoreductase
MNRILELNPDEMWVRCQPGIVLDVLNAELAGHGLWFAPDPATSSRATIGGMLGNNSAGTKSLLYGMSRDHVLESKVLLSDGTILRLGELSARHYEQRSAGSENNARESEIYRRFRSIIEKNRSEIVNAYPKIMRRVQGYNLDAFTDSETWNLSKLFIGSEGTLGIFLEARLNLVPLPKSKILCTVHFSDLLEAIRAVSPILEHKPSAVEIMDDEIMNRARENLSIRPLTAFIEGNPKAVLIVEFFGENIADAGRKAETLAARLQKEKRGYAWPIIAEPSEQAKVWSVRKHGLGLMLGMKGDRKPLPFIEDCAVPIDVLPEYIDEMLNFCRKLEVPVAMYAHASVGVIHVRPALSLKNRDDIEKMKAIAAYAFGLVKEYGGSLSGEHGDGRVRSPFLEDFFGEHMYGVFREVKKLFDPAGLMNPGVIIDPNPMDQDLRYGDSYQSPSEPGYFHFREDGSFAAAVEMCTGVGDCRQRLIGYMCPSYRATLDERHSTRGRANALRLAMTGQLGENGLAHRGVYGVMSTCLSCKSCKSECPSNVDMARLKGEFLQRLHDEGRTPIGARLLKNSADTAAKIAGPMAPAVNFLLKRGVIKNALEAVAGLDRRRQLPAYARKSFSKWFDEKYAVNIPGGAGGRAVALFCDTPMNYHQPDVGRSACELLESCGYTVVLADAGCCQRPKISHGFLREAKRDGLKTLQNLDEYIERGLKVVVCEPSCCSALIDDLPDLIDDVELGNRIKEHVMMIDQFLAAEIRNGNLDCDFESPYSRILIHGHSHRNALFGTSSMKYLLDRVRDVSVKELDAGCCGMIGDFGYEKRHYDLSMQIGEERLFPEIRSRDDGAAVVACGFGCRTQIADGTGVAALHWVDAIRGKNRQD